MIVTHDPRAVVRARGALTESRNALAAASTRLRQARIGAVDDLPAALESAQTELEHAWDAVAYADAELAAYLGGD